MNKLKTAFSAAALLVVCLFSLTTSFAQIETQPKAPTTYEVVLQTITASNSPADKNSIPSSLVNVVRKLKNLYSFSDYRLSSTYLQRTAGSIELKSIANSIMQDNSTPIFSEWTLAGLRSFPDAQGKNTIQFQSFRFGQRVPVRYSGDGSAVVNYEQIGITLQGFGVPENIPTVVGSLSTSKTDELMFLILTVKSAE